MDEIKRALLGDKAAQQAVTDRGELLPCPKCLSDDLKIDGNGHDIFDPETLGYLDSIPHDIIWITCRECNYTSDYVDVDIENEPEEAEKELIADWNIRPQILTAEEMARLRKDTNVPTNPTHINREAWGPCEFCGEWIGEECTPKEDACYRMYAGFCKQVAVDDFWEDETEDLRYCPMCGRPLTDEAVDMVIERMEALHSETKTD